MPRYLFDVRHFDGDHREDDPAGVVLPDDAAAREFGLKVIRGLMQAEEDSWEAGRWRSRSMAARCGGFHLMR
jgi:Domain of unknown function (DUF6894)